MSERAYLTNKLNVSDKQDRFKPKVQAKLLAILRLPLFENGLIDAVEHFYCMTKTTQFWWRPNDTASGPIGPFSIDVVIGGK